MSLIVLEVHLSWETVPAAASLLACMWSDSCYIVAFHEGTKIDSSHLNEGSAASMHTRCRCLRCL